MHTLYFTLCFVIALTVIRRGIACPHHWLRFGDSCFAIIDPKNTWLEAAEVCELMHGYLAEVDSMMEDIFIKAVVRDRHALTPSVWLGGNDLLFEGDFLWTESNLALNYTDWCKGQPNSFTDDENCLVMSSICDWGWRDLPCTDRYSAICEMKAPPKTVIG